MVELSGPTWSLNSCDQQKKIFSALRSYLPKAHEAYTLSKGNVRVTLSA